MTNINLLPWRDERRQIRQREFILMIVGAAILGIAGWWLWNQSIHTAIDGQQSRNQFIKKHISGLNEQIKTISELEEQRSELLSRMKVIQDLQGNRPNVVHVFDQLVRTLPDGVYYTSLTRKGEHFTIQGVATDNNQISNLMRHFTRSPWFQAPVLKTVVAQGKENAFTLTVEQSLPKEKPEERK